MATTGKEVKKKYFFPVTLKLEDLFDWCNEDDSITESTTNSDLPRKGTKVFINEEHVVLFRFKDVVRGIQGNCPHMGAELEIADIECLPNRMPCVNCPMHHYCFDLADGKTVSPKGTKLMAKVYPVKIGFNGYLRIGFDSWHPKSLTGADF